mgnify:CR=1 FL=1
MVEAATGYPGTMQTKYLVQVHGGREMGGGGVEYEKLGDFFIPFRRIAFYGGK